MNARRQAMAALASGTVTLLIALGFLAWRYRQSQSFLLGAQQSLERGEPASARFLYRQAFSLWKATGEAPFRLIGLDLAEQDPDAALEDLRYLPPSNPRTELAMVDVASLLAARNRISSAQSVLRTCLQRFPASIAARQQLVDLADLTGRDDQLGILLDELWEAARRRSPLDQAWVASRMFLSRFDRDRPKSAWTRLMAAEAVDPEHPDVQTALARLQLAYNGDVEDASSRLEDVLRQWPNDPRALEALARHSIEHGGGSDEAIEALLDRWVTDAPNAAIAEVRGDFFVRQRKLREGRREYEEALRIRPNSAVVHRKLGLLLHRLAQREKEPSLDDEGQKHLETASRLDEAEKRAGSLTAKLVDWLQPESGPPSRTGATRELLVDVTLACESAGELELARRWCQVLRGVWPNDLAVEAIRRRVGADESAPTRAESLPF